MPKAGKAKPGKRSAPVRETQSIPIYIVYVLTCRDGSLYVGWTNDLEARLATHRRRAGSRYVRSRLPCTLRASWAVADRGAALREEARFRRQTRAQKLIELASREVARRRPGNVRRAKRSTDADQRAPDGSRTRPTSRRS